MKLHHAAVLISSGDHTRILVDPGTLGARPQIDGITAILVTHHHYDHADPDILHQAVALGIPIWLPVDAQTALDLPEGKIANPGDKFRIGDVSIDVLGDRHAQVHPELPGPLNRAYSLNAGQIVVTGDEHPEDLPGSVGALVTPIDAPWLRAVDLIRFTRRAQPRLLIGVHDGLLNDDGLHVAATVLQSLTNEGADQAVLPRIGEIRTI